MRRGRRDSEWLVLRRCLALIRCAQRGPADRDGLLQAVLTEVGPEAYGLAEGPALHKRLHNDLTRIRNSLGVDLKADRRSREYFIQDSELPLLDLPDEDLATLAWLGQTFQANSPRHREVQALLARLQLALAPVRRLAIEQHRTGLVLDLGQQDQDAITPEVEENLTQALARRRRVEFDYRSPNNEDGLPRRHVADIYEGYYFDTARGHYYVRGWCRYAREPDGREVQVNRYIPYRLGRMSNLHLLPDKLDPSPPSARLYKVEYWLSPLVSRQGVTYRRWIDIQEIEPLPDDDGVFVRGATDNIFFAVQELMHYGANCRVRGGPEMLRRMRAVVQKMAELYRQEE